MNTLSTTKPHSSLRILFGLFAAAASIHNQALGADRLVSPNGNDWVFNGTFAIPNDCLVDKCATIELAVAVAAPGDRILLEPTVHNASGIVLDKSLTIESSSATVAARINAGNTDRHFIISTGRSVSLNKLVLERGMNSNGGALLNHGTANLRSVYFMNNEAVNGGALFNTGVLTGESNVNFSANVAQRGGAIFNSEGGSITLDNTLIRENLALDDGFLLNGGDGGAIVNDSLSTGVTLTNAQLLNNIADHRGGALFNSGIVTIEDSELSGNEIKEDEGYGGHIYNLGGEVELRRNDLEEGIATNDGGAIANILGGSVTLQDTELSQNQALRGGAIYNFDAEIIIERSSLAENTATSMGGGVFNAQQFGSARVILVNSTLSGNVAGISGGGVENRLIAVLNVANTTFAGNEAATGGAINNTGVVDINNSIIANTLGDDCNNGGNITGTANLVDDNAGGGGCSAVSTAAVTGLDLVLGFHGGYSRTHAIDPTSNAVDAGFDNCSYPRTPFALDEDQRLHARPQGAACDIGSYESP